MAQRLRILADLDALGEQRVVASLSAGHRLMVRSCAMWRRGLRRAIEAAGRPISRTHDADAV